MTSVAALALRQSDGQKDQAERADQKSECVAGQQMRDAESGGNPNREQQKNRNHHLREIEADLRDGGVQIAAAERPPALCHWLRS